MGSVKEIIRGNFYGGLYVYAIVEEINLGLATVRLCKGGARLTQLPVIGGQVLVGERVIVDYSSNVPPVVRPIEEHPPYDDEIFDIAPMLPLWQDEEEEDLPPVYWKGGDHGAQVFAFGGGTIANDVVYWNQMAYDTDGFYTKLSPVIKIPAPGFYFFVADVGWPPLGSAAGYLDSWASGQPRYPLDTPIDLIVTIESESWGIIGADITHPIPRAQKNKYHTIVGQAPLKGTDEVVLRVNVEGIDGCSLIQDFGLCPRLTVQWLGNINEKFTPVP